MKIDLVAVGRLKSGPERDLCERYSERLRALGRGLALDGPRLIELPESAARRDADRKAEEGAAIRAALIAGYRLITLDEGGTSMPSDAFAQRIARYRDDGAAGLVFVVGGADGLAESLRHEADLVLAFGKMTIPHQLVRVLLLEQLYRAGTILAGHPYHRA